jgi:hypothetical protein
MKTVCVIFGRPGLRTQCAFKPSEWKDYRHLEQLFIEEEGRLVMRLFRVMKASISAVLPQVLLLVALKRK